jgi:ribosomal-protein-alanine N-acetyltransferase
MFPEMFTDRCRLRKIVPTDQQQIFEGLSDDAVIKYYGVSYSTFAQTKQQMDWYENLLKTKTGIWWGICLIGGEKLIGACGFNNINREHWKAEMGYWMLKANWHKGIMKEVLPSIIEYAFNKLNLHRIEASVEAGNTASKLLLGKLGFAFEGRLKECEFKNGKFIDLEYFALLNQKKNIS